MGKPTGFLEYSRCENASVPALERISSFSEFHPPLDEPARRKQAARCMNCGVPFCQSAIKLSGMVTGCPLYNLIPEWNDEIYHGHFAEAAARLMKTASFPEFTGRVCPALCEKACVNGRDGEPVTIRENELYTIERAFAEGYISPRIPFVRTEYKVAVVGSGPSGLAAADLLNRRGHNVTVYERDDRIGGLLMYGIPNMKLDKSVVDRRVRLMETEGVTFVTGADVGRTFPASALLESCDAVVLCCGAKQPRPLAVDTGSVKGVYYAVDFLSAATKSLLGDHSSDSAPVSAHGLDVVIVGGGDTGNDCVGTCIRMGCRSVTQLEMLPPPPSERAASNPWPEWPRVLKTDYGQQEAIAVFGHDPRVYETTVKELLTDDAGRLTAVKTVRVSMKTVDGRSRMVEVDGSEQTLPAQLLLIAAGFTGCESYVPDAFGTALTPRGVVSANDRDYKTSLPKVFSAGDMRRGQSLVVWAIAEGRACAKSVDSFLTGIMT
ncbi:MAG: glutamate synthase subunit beta [Clostridiaceae bacterium]|nr:glutamate synthase subunit beta [Clostridiaceae bacterium]